MDFALSHEDKRLRDEVRAVIKSEPREDLIKEIEAGKGPGVHWRKFCKKLGEKGWVLPTAPREWGGMGGTHVQRFIIWDEMLYHRVGHIEWEVGPWIVAPTLMIYGSEEQKRKYLPRIARGEDDWAGGYSEPQAGSDLGAIEMRAVEEENDYVITGQKVFNTGCHFAKYHWLLARTDPNRPRYQGMSLFIVDMNSPGITVRPLWCMDGERTNEVFYDGVHVPKANLVGEKNRGFQITVAALAFERNMPVGPERRAFEELIAYVKETKRNGIALAEDPQLRQEMAQLRIELEGAHLLGCRVAWMADNGMVPQAEAAEVKLFTSELRLRLAKTGMRFMGLYGQLREDSPWAPLQGSFERMLRHGTRRAIAAGTSEIQRNTIATRGLGLPR